MIERRPRLAIVEDDGDLRDTLVDYFTALDYPVWGVASAEACYKQLLIAPVEILILDLVLPGEDGLALAAHLGQQPAAPAIIVLSARDQTQDRLAALAAGADRYLVKPVALAEIAANVTALWRRQGTVPVAAVDPAVDLVAAPSAAPSRRRCWRLHLAPALLEAPDGMLLHLTQSELRLLCSLTAAPGQVIPRARLIETVFGRDAHAGSARLDVLVARLRAKLRRAGVGPPPFATAHGLGYVLRAPLVTV